jgi:hypothetical protein
MIQLTPAAAASQSDFHPIVGDAHFDMSLGGDGAELRGYFAFVGCANVGAAMRRIKQIKRPMLPPHA